MSTPVVYLNGEFAPLEEAKVSVLDRGFIFGDGVYEVIPSYGRKLFRLEQHLRRLQNSLDAIRIANPLTDQQWCEALERIINDNEGVDQSIYLQVTRGKAKRDHRFPDGAEPTVFVMSTPLQSVPAEILEQGISAVTVTDIRWQWCYIKSINLLPNILLRQQAADNDAEEAILVRDGVVTEGAASNVFVVKDGVLMTPPKSEHLLPGITRDLVVELAARHELRCEQQDFDVDTLQGAEEIWLTSSTKEIMPVTQLDGKPIGEGQPGSVWQHMYGLYQEYKRQRREAN